jgi:hypothetical protein
MLLDANGLQSYLQHAFDHYSTTLDIPFDFVQASFLHNPIPSSFGGSILRLAVAMAKEEPRPKPRTIFNKLGNLVASCIMLDTVRNTVLGTYSINHYESEAKFNRNCKSYLSSVPESFRCRIEGFL